MSEWKGLSTGTGCLGGWGAPNLGVTCWGAVSAGCSKGDPTQAVLSLWGTVPPHLNAMEPRDGASDMASSELSQAQGPASMSHQDQKGLGSETGLESKVQQGSTAHPGDRAGNNSIRMWLSNPRGSASSACACPPSWGFPHPAHRASLEFVGSPRYCIKG